MTGSALLRARGVTRWYGRGSALVRAVDEVDLEVPAGQTLAIMGPSGCGKSTLLHLLGGLQRPTDGEIWLAEHRIDTMSERGLAATRSTRWPTPPRRRGAAGGASGCPAGCPPPY